MKKKEITKLLLKGCNCENCKFSHATSKRWCKNQKRKPEENVCIAWERSLLDLSTLFDIVRTGYPSLVASDIVGEYPMKKATSEISLMSRILSGEKIEIEDVFNEIENLNGKRTNKKTSKK